MSIVEGQQHDAGSKLVRILQQDKVNIFEAKGRNLVYLFIGDKSFLVSAVKAIQKWELQKIMFIRNKYSYHYGIFYVVNSMWFGLTVLMPHKEPLTM